MFQNVKSSTHTIYFTANEEGGKVFVGEQDLTSNEVSGTEIEATSVIQDVVVE
jgi:hypothetical protein